MEPGRRLEVDVWRAPCRPFLALAIVAALESPRWLLKVGRMDEGQDVLARINGKAIASDEAVCIRESLTAEEGRLSELFTSGFGRASLLALCWRDSPRPGGITPVFSYLPSIFQAAGTNRVDAFFQSVPVSGINLVFTLVALWLVDKAGRRTLLIAGIGAQAAALSTVGLFYFIGGYPIGILVAVMAFVAGHAVGNGVVCWVILSEIFPTKVRGRNVHRNNFVVGVRLPGKLGFSDYAKIDWKRRSILGVYIYGRRELVFRFVPGSRNQGTFAGRHRKAFCKNVKSGIDAITREALSTFDPQ